MNILQLISSGGYYGAESMLLSLARTLPELGCGSMVGVFADSRAQGKELEARAAAAGVAVETVPCNGKWDWNAVRRIRQLVETHSVDVLHTHGYKADIYGCLAVWPNRAALAATCHNWPDKSLTMRAYAAIDRWVLRRFDRVATASATVAEILSSAKVAAPKLQIVPNGVDMAPFRDADPRLRHELGVGSEPLIGFIGRCVPDKGGDQLISAAQAVRASYPNAKFVFVGDGPARGEWESLARKLGIASQVLFTGLQTDMPGVYASLDMVVLPSFVENMPMCLLEALSAARPVVATAVGAVPQVIIPGVTGLLCDPGDVDALSAAIKRLLREPDLARALGNHGRAHVARHYAAEVAARSYVKLYQEAVSEHSRQTDAPEVWQRSRS